jgi:acyl-CoA carboxylase subunit beta
MTDSGSDWFDSLTPFEGEATSRDPLGFPGYLQKLARAHDRVGERESVIGGLAECDGVHAVAITFNFGFLGGSMGEATGRRILRAIDEAIARRLPLVSIIASGGARMQEGMFSLIQMRAIAGRLNRLADAGLPHLAVACDPTTGGVWVSLATSADVVLASAGASIAFSGRRVRGSPSDSWAFTAEGKFESGAVDRVLPHRILASSLRSYLRILSVAVSSPADPCPPPPALPDALAAGEGWVAVKQARNPTRPHAGAYLQQYFEELAPISGDRAGGADPSMFCGIGIRDGRAIAYAAQSGTANSPAGFRTATRLVKLAERLGIPVLTLIDTPGAASDEIAERAGIGNAIGALMSVLASASVPITSLLIGEGVSGGALALASDDALWAVPSSYFSVLAPESAAAILHPSAASAAETARAAAETADALKLGAAALVEFGIARGIVSVRPADRQVCGCRDS